MTEIDCAPSTTWLLVMMLPVASRMTPEPVLMPPVRVQCTETTDGSALAATAFATVTSSDVGLIEKLWPGSAMPLSVLREPWRGTRRPENTSTAATAAAPTMPPSSPQPNDPPRPTVFAEVADGMAAGAGAGALYAYGKLGVCGV